MMKKKVYLFIWIILSITVLIFTIMHPRLNNMLLLLLCMMKCIMLFCSKKEKNIQGMLKKNIALIILFVIVWYISGYFNIFFPYHTAYEYRNDIANYKMGNTGEYYSEFPDKIPDEAKNIKWICISNFIQGSGYNALFFHANSSYLEKLYEKYSDSAIQYNYSNYGWENLETGKAVTFPKINDMTEEEKLNTIVFVTYDNGDANYPHSSGLYINQTEGYVCFYVQ